MFVVLALPMGCQSTTMQRSSDSARDHGATAVQALIGVAEFSDFEFERSDPNDPASTATADLSTMPALGAAGQYALGGRNVEFGLDGGVLFSWNSDSEVVAVGGGNAVIVSDRKLLLVDVFLGGYASALLGDRVRLYGAVGPSLMWGDAEYRDEVESDSGSAFGVGYYVRGGAEYRLANRSFLGLGVRWVDTTLDFGGQIGDVDAEGIQAFLTFTQGF
jgi:hypothetical protein